jgi:hypothetical protein
MTELSRSARRAHDKAWELLPWLVNGTLAGQERAEVETHVRTCLPCRRELKEQLMLRAAVHESAVLDRSPQQGFDALMRRVDQPAGGGNMALFGASARSKLRSMIGRLVARGPAPWGPYAAAGAVIVLLGLGLLYQPNTGGIFQTLSSGAATDALMLDIIFVPNATASERQAVLDTIVGTVEPRGGSPDRYRVRLDPESTPPKDAHELMERLRSDSRIVFAGWAPGGAPDDR